MRKILLLVITLFLCYGAIGLNAQTADEFKKSIQEEGKDDDMPSNAYVDPFAEEKKRSANILKESALNYIGKWLRADNHSDFIEIKNYLWGKKMTGNFFDSGKGRFINLELIMSIQADDCRNMKFAYKDTVYFLHLEEDGVFKVTSTAGDSFKIFKVSR